MLSTFRFGASSSLMCGRSCLTKRLGPFVCVSMYFLLKKDGLILPYIVLQLAYTGVAVAPFLAPATSKHLHVQQLGLTPGYRPDGSAHPLFRAYVMVPAFLCIGVAGSSSI